MFDRRPTDVPRASHHLFSGTSHNWILQTSRGRHHLDFLNICSFCKKQKQICNARTITSKRLFFHQIIIFCIPPESLLKVPCPLQGTSPERHLPDPAGCFLGVFLLDNNVFHPKIVVNHGFFIPLKYSLTDLITKHFQENNTLFYDL